MKNPGEFDASLATHIALFRSWKSLKPWVQIWLWFLNGLFWCALLWLDKTEARFALLAYVAVLPVGLAIIVPQRGLTRLSGLMHLPFLALVIWLAPQVLSFQQGGLYGAWLQALFWANVVCVAFDAVDVIRWIKGERYRLGTPQAVAAGASNAAKTGL